MRGRIMIMNDVMGDAVSDAVFAVIIEDESSGGSYIIDESGNYIVDESGNKILA